MGRRHAGNNAEVRIGNLRQALNFAGMVGAEFDHRDSVVLVRRNSVSGKPTKLFKFPSVLRTLRRNDWPSNLPCAMIAATISLVVVLPLEPVMASTLGASFSRR